MKKKPKTKVFYRFIEINDFTLNPKLHGEYSNRADRIWGKFARAKIEILSTTPTQ